MKRFKPHKIYLEKAAQGYAVTEHVLRTLPDVPVETVEDVRALQQNIRSRTDAIGEGKRDLLLAYDRGRSFKPFPESEDYLSCDYHTLHLAEGCDLECSYCILQAYLTNPMLTVYVNIEDALNRLQETLLLNPERFFRIGTGQLADSLSLDHLTGFSKILVPFFASQSNAVLELKTKSDGVDSLLNLDSKGKTIVSWSMNSLKIQSEEEHKCATLEERFVAAGKVIAAGYRTGFHFDPIIDYPGWEKDYSEILEKLFAEIPAVSVAWISLGCLRMMKGLKPIMQQRFPKSNLATAEWIRGMDGKLRYFKPRRIEIYRAMAAAIRRLAPEVPLYLCMESPEVWRRVFGAEPTREGICKMLDTAGKI